MCVAAPAPKNSAPREAGASAAGEGAWPGWRRGRGPLCLLPPSLRRREAARRRGPRPRPGPARGTPGRSLMYAVLRGPVQRLGGETFADHACGPQCDMTFKKKLCTLLDLCVSSLRRGHANLLCIVPILTDDPRRESNMIGKLQSTRLVN